MQRDKGAAQHLEQFVLGYQGAGGAEEAPVAEGVGMVVSVQVPKELDFRPAVNARVGVRMRRSREVPERWQPPTMMGRSFRSIALP
jgi:hypothetical protein